MQVIAAGIARPSLKAADINWNLLCLASAHLEKESTCSDARTGILRGSLEQTKVFFLSAHCTGENTDRLPLVADPRVRFEQT